MTARPRILHCCPSTDPLGGIWTYIRNIIHSKLSSEYCFDTCFYPGKSCGVSVRVIHALAQEIRAKRPDLVHLHGLQTEGFNCMLGACLGSHVPRLLTVHGFIEDSKFRSPWRRAVIAKILEPATLWSSDATYTVSEYGAAKPAIKRWARRNFGHIGNALPPAPPIPAREAMVLRQRHGWTEQDLVMVCVSRLSREKGLLDLLHAFRSVNSRLPSLRLMLVGEGPDRELLERMMHEFTDERRAVIHPATPNVGHFLAAADIFVLPSLHENQSFAILEAMAAGLPVLSTRVGGTPELVQHGVTGWLVPPSCPDQLAEGMALLAADKELRRRLGQAGRTAATRDHDFDDFLYRLDSVYSELLSTKGSGQRASSRN